MKKGTCFIAIAGISCLAFLSGCSNEEEENISIVINEFMVRNSNNTTFVDCLGNHEDWVELYNNGSEGVVMSNVYISDKPDNLLKTRLHDTIIPPGGHYLLWGGDVTCEHNDHIGFNFSATDTVQPEQIIISNGKGVIIDSYSYMDVPQACEQDKSYGRSPDGSNTWKQQNAPTPGSANEN